VSVGGWIEIEGGSLGRAIGEVEFVCMCSAISRGVAIALFDPRRAVGNCRIVVLGSVALGLIERGPIVAWVRRQHGAEIGVGRRQEMAFAREAATRVVFMDQGRIVETAEPQAFFTNPRTERAKQFPRNTDRSAR
jgi:hypothetical protein